MLRFSVVCQLVVLVGLAAPVQANQVVEEVKQAGRETKQAFKQAEKTIKEDVKKAGKETKEAFKQAGSEVKEGIKKAGQEIRNYK